MLRELLNSVFKNLLDKEVTLETSAPFDPFDAHLSCIIDQRTHPLNPPQTTLPEGSIFSGTLSSPTPITIDGQFSGTLSAPSITSGHKSMIEANLNVRQATISGKVIGNVHVRDELILNSSARIEGDITVGSLTLKEGAVVTGAININNLDSNPAPLYSIN